MKKIFTVTSAYGQFKVEMNFDSSWASGEVFVPSDEPGTGAGITVYKKWDGCSSIVVKDFHSHSVADDAGEIAMYIKTVSYLADQLMSLTSFEYEDHPTLEEALSRMNCYDGADENPGITYEEESNENK